MSKKEQLIKEYQNYKNMEESCFLDYYRYKQKRIALEQEIKKIKEQEKGEIK